MCIDVEKSTIYVFGGRVLTRWDVVVVVFLFFVLILLFVLIWEKLHYFKYINFQKKETLRHFLEP